MNSKSDGGITPQDRGVPAAPKTSRSLLTCSLSRCPRRRGCCRSLRDGGGDWCPTNWNWPSHRSYSRPAPGPEDGPSPENDARPSIVSSQKSSSIAGVSRRLAVLRPARTSPLVFIASRHRLYRERTLRPRAGPPPSSSPSPSPASRRAAAPR